MTNGWDTEARKAAASHFNLDFAAMNSRHSLTFDTYEIGKITLDEYLSRSVFYEPRKFSREDFKAFLFAQSRPYPEMLDLVRSVRLRHNLKVVVVSNEGRELTEYRIRKFDLAAIVDVFVCSCFVHLRKPDLDIFRLALDLVQAAPEQAVYLEDRPMFVEVAATLGIRTVLHTGPETSRQALQGLGLS